MSVPLINLQVNTQITHCTKSCSKAGQTWALTLTRLQMQARGFQHD